MNKYFEDAVSSISEIVKFDSSLKKGEGGTPFGLETKKCLDYFLSLAESFGFKTKNYDDYVGEVIFGEGKDFAILAHLDVVPSGDGWIHDPFGGEISDGKIWGRGTLDDKGPAVATLYAMKALKDEGFKPKRTIKLILGCNEETGWACIDHYNKVAVMPEEGFTPDANFPVIYAEKGIAHIRSFFKIENPPFSYLKAGSAANMVCGRAEAILNLGEKEKLNGYIPHDKGVSYSFDGNKLTVLGKSAHGSLPELGNNAFEEMLRMLSIIDDRFSPIISFLFGEDNNLKKMSDVSGKLTMSPDLASYENGVLSVVTDIRYPATHKLEEVEAEFIRRGVDYEIVHFQEPLFSDPNGKLIQTLLSVYNEKTGRNAKPVAIGGGTYARALKCGCAFGPELEGEKAPIHEPEEFISLKHVDFLIDVYYEGIKRMTK